MYEQPDQPLPDGPFEPNWDSLSRFRVPRWYEDAKFGIFIHWGVYSVPAFGDEWYPRKMYLQGTPEFEHHRRTWGDHRSFGYKDFVPLFRAERFDAEVWIDLFVRAGAKYVMPVAEHHDGFAMYETALSRWNATQMGPRRDVIGELASAARARGMHFGVSNHRAEHWWFMNGGREFPSDVSDPQWADFYGPAESMAVTPSRAFKDDWLARCCELVDRYRPELFYFDTWAERPPLGPYRKHFAAHYYNRASQWGLDVAINYKNEMFAPTAGVFDVERGQCGDIQPRFWQSDTAVGKKSWCHVEGEEYKTAESLVGDLADVVSKNGTLLLNIGPKADGTIPDADTSILLEVGRWLGINGEAIYGTRPWTVFGEGPTVIADGHFTDKTRDAFTTEDFRFTTRGRQTLYAICLGRPAPGSEIIVRSLGANLRLFSATIDEVQLLGDDRPLRWSRDAQGLRVTLPADPRTPLPYGLTLRIRRGG
jgi:alpha-L-fucosidase